jgi:hypothetical protein
MNSKGNVWASFGSRDTGKSYEQLMLAKYYRERLQAPKRTIIYDWTKNDSTYGHIKLIDIEDLNYALPKRALVKVQERDTEYFLEKCLSIKNACIVIDDATSKFKNRVPKVLEELFYMVKNNRVELMFQFHTLRASAPALLDASNMYIIKATIDAFPLKGTCPFPDVIERLITDCRQENRNYPENKKWATRILDVGDQTIWTKNLAISEFQKSYNKKTRLDDYLGL